MRNLVLIAALLCFPIAATADNHSPTKPITLKPGERLKCYATHIVSNFWYNSRLNEFGVPLLDGPSMDAEGVQRTYKRFKSGVAKSDEIPNPDVYFATDSVTMIWTSNGFLSQEWQQPPSNALEYPFYIRKELVRYDNEEMWGTRKVLFAGPANDVFVVRLTPGVVEVDLCVKD